MIFEPSLSQQAISRIEQSEAIEDDKLKQIDHVLGVSKDAIKSSSEDAVFDYFNNFSDSSINQGPIGAHNTCYFNPLDKRDPLKSNK